MCTGVGWGQGNSLFVLMKQSMNIRAVSSLKSYNACTTIKLLYEGRENALMIDQLKAASVILGLLQAYMCMD